MKRIGWSAVAWLAAFGAAFAARKAATAIWKRATGSEGPANPADQEVSWGEALTWAALAGLGAGLARVVGRRGAVAAWERLTGEAPPGVKTA